MKILDALKFATNKIDIFEAELLLAVTLDVNRAFLKAFPETVLSSEQNIKFTNFIWRRVNGEPIAYMLGYKEFWNFDFIVTADVLIPRADSELLVELALEHIAGKTDIDPMLVLDLGTGSGAIGLSIAAECKKVKILATDASAAALEIAKLNAKRLSIKNVDFALGDWFEGVSNKNEFCKFDLIISNPPYIANLDQHLHQGDLRFEPKSALVAGDKGMDDLHQIISQAPKYLRSSGCLMVEHGYDQREMVNIEFTTAGFSDIVCFRDLSGNPRVTRGFIC